ncbi:MAG: hypothetical protein ABI557_06975 [Aureliella sp.]
MLIANWPTDKHSHPRINSGSASRASHLQTIPPSCRIACLCLAAVGCLPALAQAGLSSSDVVVAVNANSLNSRTLANHFVALRNIPAINVVVLEGVPSSEVITIDDFREKILKPLIEELGRRQLLDHIQCVAYSADFPSAVNISSDLKGIKERHKVFTPVGSINALTYLFADVLAGEPNYIALHSNFYARREIEHFFTNPAGAATEEAWNKIQQQMTAGEHKQAADGLEVLLQEYPQQHPIAYLAASQAAIAGESDRALKLLQQAVAAGWNSSRYLKNDVRFASLREKTEFQLIELSLDDSIREMQPPLAFDARVSWTPNGLTTDKIELGKHYLLSTVLGVTRGAGTSLPEAITALQRSASADYTHPQGSFYFSLTNDVRTTTRQWGFVSAVDDLQQLGFTAEVISTKMPQGKHDILGVQLGTATYKWSTSGSTLLPGAIADNLTSMGGVMKGGGGQTTLSEMLRAGAAGSSGTVTEPYSLQEKFPHAQMYVAYARGASLAEAFYSYVTGPYQLLIVGDPLCQPCSHAPQLELDTSLRELAVEQPLQLSLPPSGISYNEWLDSSEPVAKRTTPLQAAAMRILLDGIRPHAVPMRTELNIALKGLPVGYHEINLQFIAEGPLSPRSNAMIPIWIGPPDFLTLELAGTTPAVVANADGDAKPSQQISLQSGQLSINVSSAAAVEGKEIARVSLWHDAEQLEVADGGSGQFSLPLDRIGMGPVRLQAQAELSDGMLIKSLPVWLEVMP